MTKEENLFFATAWSPYIKGIRDCMCKLLKKKGMRTSFTPPTKISQALCSLKHQLHPLRTPGVYMTSCEDCTKGYIGIVEGPISTRKTKHERCMRLKQPKSSEMANYALTKDTPLLWTKPLL